MNRSLNEIGQICRKAARGSQMPWGVADEVGHAIFWLHAFGIDGVTCLVRLLEQQNCADHRAHSPGSLDGDWLAASGELSPIYTGLGISDSGLVSEGRSVRTGPIAWPVLVAGFLNNGIHSRTAGLKLTWDGVHVTVGGGKMSVQGENEAIYASRAQTMQVVTCECPGPKAPGAPVFGDAEVSELEWKALEKLAHRTYVEATEENRLKGAGAGLSDND